MLIEFDKNTFEQIEEAVREIRAAAFIARMADERQAREQMKAVIIGTNLLTNLLLNGEIVVDGECEPEGA